MENITIPEAEYDELVVGRARAARELHTRATNEKKMRARLTRLERAIARHATDRCTCANARECLVVLSRLVSLKNLREAK